VPCFYQDETAKQLLVKAHPLEVGTRQGNFYVAHVSTIFWLQLYLHRILLISLLDILFGAVPAEPKYFLTVDSVNAVAFELKSSRDNIL
jgi:hypothetical protein